MLRAQLIHLNIQTQAKLWSQQINAQVIQKTYGHQKAKMALTYKKRITVEWSQKLQV